MSWAPFLAPGRDNPFKVGREKGNSVIYYTLGDDAIIGTAAPTLTAGRDYYGSIRFRAPVVVDQLAFEFSTNSAGQNARMGLYAADTDMQPVGAPLADSGDLALTTAGVITYTPSAPLYLPRGRYLTAFNFSGGTPFFKAYKTSVGVPAAMGSNFVNTTYVTRAYAAFPTPGTAWNAVETGSAAGRYQIVLLRVREP